MIVLRLDPPIWLQTPKGQARAHFLIVTDDESDDQWKCVQHDTCEWWTWDNSDVRAVCNVTLGRVKSTKIMGRRCRS